jgi:hypothetical protein
MMTSTLNYLRLYSDEAGESHFAPMPIALAPSSSAAPVAPFCVSELLPASRHGFLHLPADWVGGLHRSPLRMWVFVLTGQMEFEATDGECRTMAPGCALLLEDTTGKGHLSRAAGNAPVVLSLVYL